MALERGPSSSSATAGPGMLPDLAGLPIGAAYRLDAEFFHVEDLDGVGESVLGSGNLNHLILQAELINGLGDPAASGVNALIDQLPATADLAARGAASRPATTTEPIFDGRLLDPGQEDAPPADGAPSDQRGFGQPTDLATLIGGSHAAGAGAFTSGFFGTVGSPSDDGAEAAAPPSTEQDDRPASPPPGEVPVDPSGGLDGTIEGVLDEVLDEVDGLLQTVGDAATPLIDLVVDVIDRAVDALPGGVGDAVGDVAATVGDVADTALDGADQVVNAVAGAAGDLVAAVDAATASVLETAIGTLTDAVPIPGVAGRLRNTLRDTADTVVADVNETATAVMGSAVPLVETVGKALHGVAGSAADTVAAVNESLQKTAAPVVGAAQQIATPVVESAGTALDHAIGQVTGAVDHVAAVVDEATAPLLDEAADLGETAGAILDGATDETASLVDDAANAVNEASAPLLDAVQELADEAAGQVSGAFDDVAAAVGDAAAPLFDEAANLGETAGTALNGATDETMSLVNEAANAVDDAVSDVGGMTDALLADDGAPADDQDLSVSLEASLGDDDQVRVEADVNLDMVEEVTGDIDLAVEGSIDVPAGLEATAATVDDLTEAVAVAEDLNEGLETLDDQPLQQALDAIQLDLGLQTFVHGVRSLSLASAAASAGPISLPATEWRRSAVVSSTSTAFGSPNSSAPDRRQREAGRHLDPGESAMNHVAALAMLLPVLMGTGSGRVIDGDTLELHDGERLQLWGIDAPEGQQVCHRDRRPWHCGDDAAKALRALVDGRRLICDAHYRDLYGAVVAVCRVGGLDVGAEMVRQGWALDDLRHRGGEYADEQLEARMRGVDCGLEALFRRGRGRTDNRVPSRSAWSLRFNLETAHRACSRAQSG